MKFKVVWFLLITTIGFSQAKKINAEYDYIKNYYQFVYQAQYEYLNENYQKAYDLLKTAEKNCPLLNQEGINELSILVECSVNLNKPKEAIHYIEILAKDYGYKVEGFKNDSTFSSIQNMRKWKKLEKNASKYYKNYLAQVNLDLRNLILKMKEDDQSVRTVKHADNKNMQLVDSINNEKLKKIVLDCDCYPSTMFNLFGNHTVDKQNFSATIFVYHINQSDSEYWKPIFLDLIKRGRAPVEIYGSLIDSLKRSTGMYDYGIYSNVTSERINDFENLDKRRIAVGLAPWQLKKDIFELLTKKYDIKW
jgi:hypothetical protein